MRSIGGIYIIVNLMECKAYVGQARDFGKRDHFQNLESGRDNKFLQEDYDNTNKELVYFVVANGKELKKSMLNEYEKLYMTLAENVGFNLYNINIARQNRNIEILDIDEKMIREAEDELNNDFSIRFNMNPSQIVQAVQDDRTKEKIIRDALDYYEKQRTNEKCDTKMLFMKDRYFFGKQRRMEIFDMDMRSIKDFDISEVFISKAGNYLSEGMDQIIQGKNVSIENKDYGYCLWAFANNAVAEKNARKCCENRANLGKDTYVIFLYTPSSVYSDSESFTYRCINKKTITDIKRQKISFENLKCTLDGNGNYVLPSGIDCTGANQTSVNAFVIDSLFLLEENIDFDKLTEHYDAVDSKNRKYKVNEGGFRRSTWLMRKKNESKCEDICKNKERGRSFCFAAKLKAPYIIKLVR